MIVPLCRHSLIIIIIFIFFFVKMCTVSKIMKNVYKYERNERGTNIYKYK